MNAQSPRMQVNARVRTMASLLVLWLVATISSSGASPQPVKLPLNKNLSSIRFGVDSASPTLQMNGAFTKFGGYLLLDQDDVTRSQVSLSLDLRSAQLSPDQILQAVFLQTAVAHLRPPETSFVSQRIERRKGNGFLVHGLYEWQGRSRAATVPIEIVRATPTRTEVRVLMNGAAKKGEVPEELGGMNVAGTKGWAKGTFIFAPKG